MSIVYFENTEEEFFIISDTKICLEGYTEKFIENSELLQNIQIFGLLKSLILKNDIVLSFAGNNIAGLNELIEKIILFSGKYVNELINLVKDYWEEKFVTDNNETELDLILSIKTSHGIKVFCFNEKFNGEEIKKGYIGNNEFYRDFRNGKVIKRTPEYLDEKIIEAEFNLEIQFLNQQECPKLSKTINSMRIISRLGYNDILEPFIGVYYNNERNQFEYYEEQVYGGYISLDSNSSEPVPLKVNEETRGDNYSIEAIEYRKGILYRNNLLKHSVMYVQSTMYKEDDAQEFYNFFVPIVTKDQITKKELSNIFLEHP